MLRKSIIQLVALAFVSSGCMDFNHAKPDAKESKAPKTKLVPKKKPSDIAKPQNPTPPEPIAPIVRNDDDVAIVDNGDALAALLKSCGATDLMGLPDEEIYYEKNLYALPKTTVIPNVINPDSGDLVVTTYTDVEIKLSKTRITRSTTTSVDTNPNPGSIVSNIIQLSTQAMFGKPNTGDVTADLIPFSRVADLSKYDIWKGMLCSFVGTDKVVNKRGGYNLVLSFEPPLPMQLSPKATGERMDTELGDYREFQGIKATVIESDKPGFEIGQIIDMALTVEKVSEIAELEDDSGEIHYIEGDSAYKISIDAFNDKGKSDPKLVMKMGLDPEMTYYIDQSKKEMIWNILDTKDWIKGKVIFQH
jgi:hypothetical protein